MRKNVIIKINGTQKSEGESDRLELYTKGLFYKRSGNYYLSYEEPSESGLMGTRTTLKIEGQEKITLLRSGEMKGQLIIERNKRHLCHYNTPVGDMFLGVCAGNISSRLSDEGGSLDFSYRLDVNASLLSENEVSVQVEDDIPH